MIEINNLAEKEYPLGRVDKKLFSTVAKIILKGENRRTQTLSLAFVNKEEIKKLNKKFRNKNKATDVLSFELNTPKDGQNYLGEIIICPEVVKEKGEEIIKVFVHGILHLCGYDHEKSKKEEKIMEEKEKYYFLKL